MRCPTCKTEVPDPPPDGDLPKHFPFCSERCRLIDLRRWIDGRYQVPLVDRENPNEPPRDRPPTP